MRLVERCGIDRTDRDLLPSAGVVGINLEDPMGLVVQIVAPVSDDVVFVLTGFELNAIGYFFEQIDGGCRVKGK